ncbi:MAG: porin family protein [Bacteroidota bacterium]|nr:porin family protein [Bacteroidota bacterium]
MRNIFFIFLFFSIALKSQNNSDEVFTLRPSLGFNGCQIHGDNYSGYDKFGVFGGISVNAKLNTKASLELGFYFSQKGSRHNQNPVKGDYSFYRVNLNYIDLPLMFKYQVNSIYFLSAGPSVAYLVNYQEDNEVGNWNGVYPFEKFEYGINVGLGRKIKDNFFVEVRSSNSISAIRPYGVLATQVFYPNAVARFFNAGLYNNILTLVVSYKINTKKKSESQQP